MAVDHQHHHAPGAGRFPSQTPGGPASSYVTWVGIDGYYHKRSIGFPALFGPTIGAVRELTADPILIAETGAAAAAGQPAKIASLFAGVRAYRLLGFVWFDDVAYPRLPHSGCRLDRCDTAGRQVLSTARDSLMRSRLIVLVAVALAAAAVAVVAVRLASAAASSPPSGRACLASDQASLLPRGVRAARPSGYGQIAQFAAVAGRHPNLDGYYRDRSGGLRPLPARLR